MRSHEAVQKDLDAVAREFPGSRGSLIPAKQRVFACSTPSGSESSFDFIKESFLNGGISKSELTYASFFNVQFGHPAEG